MALVNTATDESAEPLDLDAGMRHLRLIDSSHNGEVQELIAAARDYCERQTNRTLRTSVTRALSVGAWPCSPFVLPWPPLISLTITYYDEDGNSQTLDAANYYVELSTDGRGRVHWTENFSSPSVDARPDAVTFTFTSGYVSRAAVPPTAVQAIKTKMTELTAN